VRPRPRTCPPVKKYDTDAAVSLLLRHVKNTAEHFAITFEGDYIFHHSAGNRM